MDAPIRKLLAVAAALLAAALAMLPACDDPQAGKRRTGVNETMQEQYETAVFAGGCFWCLEADMEKLDGVAQAVSGYAGGDEPDPTYKEVSSGGTGHLESVQVVYDPARLSYEALVRHFFTHVDPADPDGQFVDRGPQYRTAIFYSNGEQKKVAERLKQELNESGVLDGPVATEILPLERFYKAETYHQDYYQEHSIRYQFYRAGSGRDAYLGDTWTEGAVRKAFGGENASNHDENRTSWSRPSREEIKERLTKMQFQVTQEDATEPAFQNEYWDEKRDGIYVDIVSGQPLFSSQDKFESGTGWPSFTRPIAEDAVTTREDRSLFSVRTEVRSSLADSHLGHVFEDGPRPTGLRYCINSAALRFIPVEDLEQEGLGRFKAMLQGEP
jgi:peptide methionine sulfoxide reductase msrA/msrB